MNASLQFRSSPHEILFTTTNCFPWSVLVPTRFQVAEVQEATSWPDDPSCALPTKGATRPEGEGQELPLCTCSRVWGSSPGQNPSLIGLHWHFQPSPKLPSPRPLPRAATQGWRRAASPWHAWDRAPSCWHPIPVTVTSLVFAVWVLQLIHSQAAPVCSHKLWSCLWTVAQAILRGAASLLHLFSHPASQTEGHSPACVVI